ncbi:hypothetical protein NYO98_10420 [Nocardioides sp. STR2]|uniref:Fibronectin type-III domain-containing protein n=1 Tax=Nocardioides pini TaxID=2975053 RepID=A0ABT4CCK1_9ACTN|nr:hypothetical protein [Nocardioides pini]MCY4726692.1 hypothetical protein [Nocardioides pini]
MAYTPLGAPLGVLPDSLTFTITDPFGSDLPTLRIEYTKHGRRFPLLETKPEVAVEWWDEPAGEWREPLNARFHVVKRSWNSKDDGAQARTYEAVHVGWLGRKARVWTGENMNSDGKRQFNAANAGTIVGTIFDDAQGRGWGPGLSRTFTATHDSAGQPWADEVTLAFEPSADLHSVIAAVVEQGMADVAWDGRALHLYNADTTLGRDLTTGDAPVWVRHNDGVTSAPEQGSIEDLVTFVRLVGDAGATWDVDNPGADTTYGRLEGYATQSGVTDEGTAALLIEQELAAGADERVQFTREFHTASATVVPWRNYRPGDWVWVDREDEDGVLVRERSRVVQISLTADAEGVSGHTTLGTRLDDLLARLARRTASVTGGATPGGAGGSPSPVSPTIPDGPDSRVPADAAGLTASSDAYTDVYGFAQARVVLDWADVTTDTEGVLLAVRGYEVWTRVGSGEWSQVTTTVASDVALSPLPTGQAREYRVRAVSDSYVAGGWSNVRAVTTAKDTTPPPAPSKPILTSRMGVVTATWNGSPAMPADFARVVIEVSSNMGLTWRAVGEVTERTGGSVPITGLPYDTAVMARARAYDRVGNVSTSETTLLSKVDRIVGGDLELNSVKANNLAAGAVDGMVVTGATVRTAETGQRVVLDTEGLRAFPASGSARTTISAATGRLTAVDAEVSGTVTAGTPTGYRVVVSEDTTYGGAVVGFYQAASKTGTITSWQGGGVRMAGMQRTIIGADADGTGTTAMWLDVTSSAGGYEANVRSRTGILLQTGNGHRVKVSGGLEATDLRVLVGGVQRQVLMPVFAKRYSTADQRTTSGGDYAIVTLNGAVDQQGIGWEAGYFFRIQHPGVYLCQGSVVWERNTRNRRAIRFVGPAGAFAEVGVPSTALDANGATHTITTTQRFNAGDWLYMDAFQNAAQDLSLLSGVANTWVAITKIGE